MVRQGNGARGRAIDSAKSGIKWMRDQVAQDERSLEKLKGRLTAREADLRKLEGEPA